MNRLTPALCLLLCAVAVPPARRAVAQPAATQAASQPAAQLDSVVNQLPTIQPATPVELGRINWLRDMNQAVAAAKKTGRPMMVLFDEVPGCSTCRNFGAGPLSHPIVLDASRLFVPVAVYNNVKGEDAQVLKRFGEAAGNNPVVRFTDADGKDLIGRSMPDWKAQTLVKRMREALVAAKRNVPPWLALVADEYAPAKKETAAFAMFCYWTGEKSLGAIHGVLATRTGQIGHSEVVEVDYDPTKVSYARLLEQARQMKCATKVFARNDEQMKTAKAAVGSAAERSDAKIDTNTQQQYHLFHRPAYYYLPLTALQATKANARIADNASPDELLSPRQLALKTRLAAAIKSNPKLEASLRELELTREPQELGAYAASLEKLLAKESTSGE